MDARSSKIANKRLALEIFSKDTQKTTAGSYVFGVLNSGPPETLTAFWIRIPVGSLNPFDPSHGVQSGYNPAYHTLSVSSAHGRNASFT